MLDPLSKMLLSGAGSRGTITLMYHSVEPGSGRPDWPWAISRRDFDAQLDLLVQGGWQSLSVADLAGSGTLPERSVVITFDDGYRDNQAAFQALAERKLRATLFMVSGDVGGESSWGVSALERRALLDRNQLLEIMSMGMEVGSHSCSHPRLTQLDDEHLLTELVDSRKVLQDLLDAPIDSFAYPYGDYDARVVDGVREAGYSAACVTRSGWGRVDADPLRIRRVAVMAGDSLATFARKLAFADNDASWGQVQGYYVGRLRARLAG